MKNYAENLIYAPKNDSSSSLGCELEKHIVVCTNCCQLIV